MKKLVVVLGDISFLFACSGKEEPQIDTTAQSSNQQLNFCKQNTSLRQQLLSADLIPSCQIDSHDCWQVVQNINNPSKLKEMGITIVETHYPGLELRSFN